MNKKQKKALDLVSIFFSGSVLETIIEAMKSDDGHSPFTDDPINPGETIIGELSKPERAIVMARIRLTEEHNIFADKVNSMMNTTCENINESGIEIMKMYQKTRRLSNVIDALEDLLWDSIRIRLSDQGIDNVQAIAYRDGNKIVRLNSLGSEDFRSLIKSVFELAHKCHFDCPSYADCNLPFKQAEAAQG